MIQSRIFGSIMLIVGTSIGGGMLALPVVTAASGYVYSSLSIILIWFFMTAGSLLVLEVNLALPAGSNLVSMAKYTLGKTGMVIAWLSYGLILYSVLCAYIAGGADLLGSFLTHLHLPSISMINSLVYVVVLGSIVWFGTRFVDYANRGLMFIKLGALLILMLAILPKTHLTHLISGKLHALTGAFMVMATSFTFSIIVPSIRYYLHSHVKQIRFSIIVGSLIPLVCYLLWNYIVQSSVPIYGSKGLIDMQQSGQVVANLTLAIMHIAHSHLISLFVNLFTSVCMFTTFLAASLSLSDFIADGLKLEKKIDKRWIPLLLTFIPPLAILLINPNIFLAGIRIAGIFCVIIVMILPPFMAWQLRYKKDHHGEYQVSGGKPLLIITAVIGILLIMSDLFH